MSFYNYPSRTICDVLKEMRKCYEVCNFSTFPSLIEELQILANRMEAKLDTQKNYFEIRNEINKKKKELKKLDKKLKKKKNA